MLGAHESRSSHWARSFIFPFISMSMRLFLGVAVTVSATYLIGSYNLPIIYAVGTFAFFIAYELLIKNEAQEVELFEAHMAARDPAVLKKLLGPNGMPTWVKFPDVESAEWLNTTIRMLWPNLSMAIGATIEESVKPIIEGMRPIFLSKLSFRSESLGKNGPIINGVKVYENQEKEIIIDLDIVFDLRPEIAVIVGVPAADAEARITRLFIAGKLRVTLKGFIPTIPGFSAVSISFVERPDIKLRLSAARLRVLGVPGLEAWIDNMIEETITNMLVFPQNIFVPLVDLTPEEIEMLNSQKPVGRLVVKVLEGLDFPKMDRFGHCDGFIRAALGKQKFKTNPDMNSKNPVWNSKFRFDVYNSVTEKLVLKAYDWDQLGSSDFIGECILPVADLDPRMEKDLWLPLEKAKSGSIHLKLMYTPIATRPEPSVAATDLTTVSQLTRQDTAKNFGNQINSNTDDICQTMEPEFDQNRRLSEVDGAIGDLVLKVERVSGLSILHKQLSKLNCYVQVTVCGHSERTESRAKSYDHEWDQEFKFPVDDAAEANVLIQLIQARSLAKDKVLADVCVPAIEFLNDANDVVPRVFALSGYVADAKVEVAGRLTCE